METVHALQGMSEPVGAFFALLFAGPYLTPALLDWMLSFVGGIMVSCGNHSLESWYIFQTLIHCKEICILADVSMHFGSLA